MNQNTTRRVTNRISIRPDPNNADSEIVIARVTAFAEAGAGANGRARKFLEYYAAAGIGERAVESNEFEIQNLNEYMITSDPTAGTHTDNVFTDDASALIAASHLMQSRPNGFSVHVDLGHNMQYHAPGTNKIAYSAAGRHFLSTYVDWIEPTPVNNAQAYEWADRFTEVASRYAKGSYLNQVDTQLYPQKIRQSFSADNWQRLQDVRQQYDPENRFFSYVGIDTQV